LGQRDKKPICLCHIRHLTRYRPHCNHRSVFSRRMA
jgi:hypothetical protein